MPGVYEGTCPQCGRKNWATDWALAYYTDDDRVEFLAHPNESDEITRFGTTLDAAQFDGRLVWSDTIVCNACGVIGSRNKLHSPGPRGLRKWFTSRERLRIQLEAMERRQTHLLPTHRCTRCGSDDLVDLGDYVQGGGKIACADCGARELKLEICGLS